jgi:hypothetical protein
MKDLSKILTPWIEDNNKCNTMYDECISRISIERLYLKIGAKYSIIKYNEHGWTSFCGVSNKTKEDAIKNADSWFHYYDFTLLTEGQFEKYSILL